MTSRRSGDQNKKFLIYFEIDPEKRDENVARLKASGPGVPENAKLVSLWYSTTLLEGWCAVEAEDAISLGEIQKHWTDLNLNHITPVLTEDVKAKFDVSYGCQVL
jgi:hypothetical protein